MFLRREEFLIIYKFKSVVKKQRNIKKEATK